MTFPLGPVRGIASAVQVTQNLIHSVQDSMGFDRVLAGESIQASEPESTSSLLEQTVDAIRRRLTSDGFAPTSPLSFSTNDDGTLQLETPSTRAAAIETSLVSDSGLRSLVAKLHARLGATPIEVTPVASGQNDGLAANVDLSR